MLIFVLYLCIDIFSLYRSFRSLRQLERVAEQSEDLDNLRIFHYCVELMIGYKKKTSKQVKELVKRLNKKTLLNLQRFLYIFLRYLYTQITAKVFWGLFYRKV